MKRRSDFNGDGRHEIPITSPWGFGLLEVDGFSLRSPVMAANGARFSGGWLLNTADNRFDLVADVDGDGRAEIVVASPWGVGVIERSGSRMRTVMLRPNGTRFSGGWLLNTVDNRLGPAGDFDGDGREELFVSSPWGVGVWKLDGTTFRAPVMAANGTRFDGWLLNTADNRVHLAGDVDGDGCDELLISSPWGIAILKQDGSTFDTVVMAPNDTWFGDWRLNTADNQFLGMCDIDGDGRDEIIVASPWGLGVLELQGGTLGSRHMAQNGSRIGQWLVNSLDNRFFPTGDYDGDGRAEILFASPWGIGVLDELGGALRMTMMAANGTRFGGWLLNTSDNRFGPVGDFDGDGRDELVVSSPWGMAVLNINGASVSPRVMDANGTRFAGGWLLNTGDNRIGIGPELLRLHVKVLQNPTIAIADMVTEMQRVYAGVGLQVELASTETLNLGPAMLDVSVGACAGAVTAEQTALFANRNNAPTTDVVAYFVRSTVPPFNGCASSPPGLPGSVVAQGASRWTLGHEIGHNLDLRHVTSSDSLMTGGGTANITNPPPDIAPSEAITMKASLLTHPL